MRKTRVFAWTTCLAIVVFGALIAGQWQPVAAGGPVATGGGDSGFRVLKPIESGDLTLFPVVRNDGKAAAGAQFLTLDEGFKSGEVEVTEAGKVRGLVRSRNGGPVNSATRYQGDQVNTLVLVNNSNRPLLLLAGEIVTGGKQDRIIAKDRIVPAGADPIDLSVFCVEHGRWTESSAKFGATASNAAQSFMVQPAVRQQAMVAKDQQQVWNSVSGAVSKMAMAAAPPKPASHGAIPAIAQSETVTVTSSQSSVAMAGLGTTSYAKAMQNKAVSAVVDQETAGMIQSREQILATLRQEHAVGVVVAVRGEVIWADIFSDPELLSRYWSKLVRSYAAEGIGGGATHKTATIADAQAFLDTPGQRPRRLRGRGRRLSLPRGEDRAHRHVLARIPAAQHRLRRPHQQAHHQEPAAKLCLRAHLLVRILAYCSRSFRFVCHSRRGSASWMAATPIGLL